MGDPCELARMINTSNITASVSRRSGGLFVIIQSFSKALALTPMQVSVLGIADKHNAKDLEKWSPVTIHAIKPFIHEQFGYSPLFMRYLDLSNPDILHTHGLWTYASIVTQRYASGRKIPYVVSPQGMLDPWAVRNSHWKKVLAHYFFEQRHLNQASCMRALCHSEAVSFRKYGLKNPICIIPNGIELPNDFDSREGGSSQSDLCNPLQREAKNHESGFKHANLKSVVRRTLLFLGRIHPKKGLVNAIRAWSAIEQKKRKAWQFVIAGWDQGGHQRELIKLCKELGLSFSFAKWNSKEEFKKENSAEIIFTGEVFGEKKQDLLRSADAFILPSYSEGMPMSVLEAWAYGLPVLMTPECNLQEGFNISAAIKVDTNIQTITMGMNELFMMSQADLTTMGARGKQLVKERFTWTKVAAKTKQVYNWILGGGARPDCVINE